MVDLENGKGARENRGRRCGKREEGVETEKVVENGEREEEEMRNTRRRRNRRIGIRQNSRLSEKKVKKDRIHIIR